VDDRRVGEKAVVGGAHREVDGAVFPAVEIDVLERPPAAIRAPERWTFAGADG